MGARGRMTMRAPLQRDTQAAEDGYGQKAPADWNDVNAALPCLVYSKMGGVIRTVDGKKSVTVETLKGMVPLGTDVTGGDRFNGVVDRLGNVLHATPLVIQGVQRRATHFELTFKDTST